MTKRFATAVATGAVVVLPLLAGCGASSDPQGASAAPAASSAAAPSTAAASTPSPSSDPSQESAAVQSAAEKFYATALTIGYPDTRYNDYIKRLKPLMTSKAFDSFSETTTTTKKRDAAIKKLTDQGTRNTPKIKGEKVTSVTADAAEVEITYQNLTQQRSGGSWKTVKTSSSATDTVKLVKDGGDWLVDDLG